MNTDRPRSFTAELSESSPKVLGELGLESVGDAAYRVDEAQDARVEGLTSQCFGGRAQPRIALAAAI